MYPGHPGKRTGRACVVCIVFGASASACSGGSSSTTAPTDVAGSYTVDVTNASNGCMMGGWTTGAMSTGIGVVIQQSSQQLTATVSGVTGAFMTLGIGTNTFSGTLTGNQGSMTATGTVQGTQGSCTFTTNATVDAAFNGDAMQGTVTYTRVPANGSSGCAALVGCQSVQNFSGARPPSAG
jgi:hypothetical protein